MLASDIISRAAILLQDTANERWTSAELLKWISDGQRLIAMARPDSVAKNEAVTLVAGTKQTLPAGAIRLLDVVRNLKDNGDPGRAVRITQREILDAQNPNWHLATAGTTLNFTYDDRDPTHFYVYPPAAANAKLEVIYTKDPGEIVSTSTALTVNEIYAEPLLNYVLYRAYAKDADFAANAQIAQGYLQVTLSLLGLKTAKDFAFSPDTVKPGGTPNIAAAQAGGV